MAQHESLLLSLGYLEEQNGFSEEEFDLEELLTELQNLIRRAMRLEDDLDLENTKAKEKSETDKIEDNKPRSNSTSQYICKFPVILSENSVKQFLHFNKSELSVSALAERLRRSTTEHDVDVIYEHKSLSDVEFSLQAKMIIDSLDITKIHIVTFSKNIGYLKELFELVFNQAAYQLEFHGLDFKTDFGINDHKGSCEGMLRIVLQSFQASTDDNRVETLQSSLIPVDLFYHGFTTRQGGVSTYPTMQSFSLMFSSRKKDTMVFVKENRRRLAQARGFDFSQFQVCRVVHGTDVWVVGDDPPESYDAIVTDKVGVTITAPGADCQTLLFCDPIRKVVGAAHSGWRGTLDKISHSVIDKMVGRFGCNPQNIIVAIGPSIGPCCYHINKDREDKFSELVGHEVITWKEGDERPYLNQWLSTTILLLRHGIQPDNIDNGSRYGANQRGYGEKKVTLCTFCNKDKFFSYRRDGNMFGNQIGFIGIK